MVYPQHDRVSQDFPVPVGPGKAFWFATGFYSDDKRFILFHSISVARVQPRTSKGITDLLLPQSSIHWNVNSPSKKLVYEPSFDHIAATDSTHIF